MSIVKLLVARGVGVLLTIPPEVNEYMRKIDPIIRVSAFSRLSIPGDIATAIICDILPGMRCHEIGFLNEGRD